MTITQRLATLLGGVSQRPQTQRTSGQAEAQVNASNHPQWGLMKRPPTEHLGNVDFGLAGVGDGFVHPVEVSPTQRYLAVVNDGTLRVIDLADGAEQDLFYTRPDNYLVPQSQLSGTETLALVDTWSEAGLSPDIPLEDHIPTDEGTSWQRTGDAANLHCVRATGLGPSNILGNLWNAATGLDTTYTLLGFTPSSADYTVRMQCNISGTPPATHAFYLKARCNAANLAGYALKVTFAPYAIGSGDARRAFLQVGIMDAAGAFTSLSGDPVTADAMVEVGLRVTGYFIEGISNDQQVCAAVDPNQTIAAAGLLGMRAVDLRGVSPNFCAFTGDDLELVYEDVDAVFTPDLRAVQVGDSTIFLNTEREVAMTTESSDDKDYEALVYVRQADFGTEFRLTLNGYAISLGSPEGTTTQARRDLDTTVIAGKLKTLIESVSALSSFTVAQYGSSLLISRSDSQDFTISADDGLADNGLRLIKGSVQSFADLPTKAPSDYVVEITGSPDNNFDNYFVKFDVTNTATNEGVWRECVKPGEPIALDPTTLPHVLTYRGSFVPPTENTGTPASPFIAPGGGTFIQERWDSVDIWGRALLDDDGDTVTAVLGDANGVETEYVVYFDVDTRTADGSNLAIVTLQKETGSIGSGVFADVDSRTYGSELFLSGESLRGTFEREAGWKIRLRLDYASGSTPTRKAKIYTKQASAISTIIGSSADTPLYHWPIEFWARTGKIVQFPATAVYPAGRLISLICDGITFSFTPTIDLSGTDVATQLSALVNAHADFITAAESDGVFLVTRADAATPVITGSVSFDSGLHYHDPELELVPDALIGLRIENITDGSYGVITDNDITTITVAEMLDGVDNSFQKGDRIRVVQDNDDPYFVLSPAPWVDREAGDLTTNPLPYFVDKTIKEVFYHKGRLGFLCENHAILSEVAQSYNFFRTSVTQLLDTDPIDATPMGEAVHFHSAALWNGEMILWAGHQQYALLGEPILSPKTVSLPKLTDYASESIRPVTLGRHAYFVAKKNDYAQIYAYEMQPNVDKPQAVQVTAHVSRYLPGNVVMMAGDENAQMLAVVTDADLDNVYVLQFDRQTGQQAWSKWAFAANSNIVGLCFLDGKLVMLCDRTGAGDVETLDLDSPNTSLMLDRRAVLAAGTGVYNALLDGNTWWTLPFTLPTSGLEGTLVVLNAAGTPMAHTHFSTTQFYMAGDHSAVEYTIGFSYTFTHTFSTMYPRNQQDDRPRIAGRLQLSRMRLSYEDTRDFTVTVTPEGRTARTYTVDEASATDGTLSFPVGCENKQATITITNATPNPCRFTDLEWEGNHYSRSRSI
jgi:hypothetical protein